jgi:predicted phosphodiesterase
MKHINLNSVVIYRNSNQLGTFADQHNILTVEKICNSLYGESHLRVEHKTEVFDIMFNMAITKLRMGERAIVHENVLFAKQLKEWAYNHGYKVYRIVENKSEHRDGKEIIAYHDEVHVINHTSLEIAISKKNGLLVIADMHGSDNDAEFAFKYAADNNLHMIILGDMLDYGAKSIGVISSVKSLVDTGQAHTLIGNHENKIYRWFMGKSVKLSHGNQTTIDQYNALSDSAKEEWKHKFISLYHMSHTHMVVNNNVGFAHAAFSEGMWWDESQKCADGRFAFAIYGETDRSKENKRIYNWVDRIGNKTVYVGHDIRSKTAAFEQTNEFGGKVVFLDTGCSKTGCLTVAHLDTSMNLVKYISF